MGVRRPVTMGLIFGFIVALWRNHLDARTINAATSRVGNTIASATSRVDIGAVHPTFSARVGDRSPRRVDPTPAVVRSSSSSTSTFGSKTKAKTKTKGPSEGRIEGHSLGTHS